MNKTKNNTMYMSKVRPCLPCSKKLYILTFVISLMFVPQLALAQSTISISPSDIAKQSEAYGPGQEIAIEVILNTRGKSIGVGEGVLLFPADDLRVKSVSKEGSIFSLWVEEPHVEGDTIVFVGGVPSGFSGSGTLFSVVFETKTNKTAQLFFEGMRVLSFEAQPKETLRQTVGAVYPFRLPRVIPTEFEFENDYQEGNRNIDIAYFQVCSQLEGALELGVTGIFDHNTKISLIAFQERRGLVGTGRIDQATRSVLNRVCSGYELPERLFDINFEIDDPVIESSDGLLMRVIFVSFGQVPTEVELTFSIYDADGNEVYSEGDFVVVETEYILSKTFKGLDLPFGKYKIVLTTLYGEGISDEFIALFEIAEEKKSNILRYVLCLLALLLLLIGAFISKGIWRWSLLLLFVIVVISEIASDMPYWLCLLLFLLLLALAFIDKGVRGRLLSLMHWFLNLFK